MKRSLVLLILFFQFAFLAEGQVMFQKEIWADIPNVLFGSTPYSISQLTSGGYLIGGDVYDSGNPGRVCLLFKTDSIGNVLWMKTYSAGHDNAIFSVVETSDFGFVLCGYTYDWGNLDNSIYVIKTDSLGLPIWSNKIGTVGFDEGRKILEISGGNYILAGSSSSTSFFGTALLARLDNSGNIIWSKNYSELLQIRDVQQTSDSCLISCGVENNGIYPFLMKTDSLGNVLWKRKYTGSYFGYGVGLVQMPDGGFALLCHPIHGPNVYPSYLIKTDSAGNSLWAKKYSISERLSLNSIFISRDSCFMIGGTYGANDYEYLIKADKNGDTLWTRTYYSDSLINQGLVLGKASDAGLILVGSSHGNVNLMKTDSSGNSACNQRSFLVNVDSVQTQTSILSFPDTLALLNSIGWGIYYSVPFNYFDICTTNYIKEPISLISFAPNPSSTDITVNCLENSNISIYNILGDCVLSFLANSNGMRPKMEIDISTLIPGLYFIKVETDKGTSVQKLIKQ